MANVSQSAAVDALFIQ